MLDDAGVSSPSGSLSSSSGLIYGLEFQCRALCAVDDADADQVRFLVGTQGLKLPNQLHLLQLDEETNTLSKTVYEHPRGEVWDVVASQADSSRFITRHSSVENSSCRTEATLWSMGGDSSDKDSSDEMSSSNPAAAALAASRQLRPLCLLDSGGGRSDVGGGELSGGCNDVSCVSWMPGSESKVMTLVENRLLLHDVGQVSNGKSKVVSTGRLSGKGHTSFTTGTWNPHQSCAHYATVNEHTVRAWDTRMSMMDSSSSSSGVWQLDNPSHQAVRSLDFNPNKQYHLATAGDDGCVRYWDVRATQKCLAARNDHSHWVWTVRFNQFHDQLVLTTSSDCHVVLSCMASISSEPHGHLVDDDDGAEAGAEAILEDGVLKRFDDHEESVYAAAWSSADPWTFASLSYDGRLVINRVPRDVKFKILNLV